MSNSLDVDANCSTSLTGYEQVLPYTLNKELALKKKAQHCLREEPIIIERKSTNLYFKFSATNFDAFFDVLETLLDQLKNSVVEDYNIASKQIVHKDKGLNIVSDIIKVFDPSRRTRNNPYLLLFTINKYRTSSTAMVNGKHLYLFERQFLPILVSHLKRYELFLASADQELCHIIRSSLGKNINQNETNSDNIVNQVSLLDSSIQRPKSEVRVLISDCGSDGKERQAKLPSPDLTIPVDQGSRANVHTNTTNDNHQTQEDIASISLLIMDGMLSTVCQGEGANSNSSTEQTSPHSDTSSYSYNESLLVSSVNGCDLSCQSNNSNCSTSKVSSTMLTNDNDLLCQSNNNNPSTSEVSSTNLNNDNLTTISPHCPTCKNFVSRGVLCETCLRWYHYFCENTSQSEVREVFGEAPYSCRKHHHFGTVPLSEFNTLKADSLMISQELDKAKVNLKKVTLNLDKEKSSHAKTNDKLSKILNKLEIREGELNKCKSNIQSMHNAMEARNEESTQEVAKQKQIIKELRKESEKTKLSLTGAYEQIKQNLEVINTKDFEFNRLKSISENREDDRQKLLSEIHLLKSKLTDLGCKETSNLNYSNLPDHHYTINCQELEIKPQSSIQESGVDFTATVQNGKPQILPLSSPLPPVINLEAYESIESADNDINPPLPTVNHLLNSSFTTQDCSNQIDKTNDSNLFNKKDKFLNRSPPLPPISLINRETLDSTDITDNNTNHPLSISKHVLNSPFKSDKTNDNNLSRKDKSLNQEQDVISVSSKTQKFSATFVVDTDLINTPSSANDNLSAVDNYNRAHHVHDIVDQQKPSSSISHRRETLGTQVTQSPDSTKLTLSEKYPRKAKVVDNPCEINHATQCSFIQEVVQPPECTHDSINQLNDLMSFEFLVANLKTKIPKHLLGLAIGKRAHRLIRVEEFTKSSILLGESTGNSQDISFYGRSYDIATSARDLFFKNIMCKYHQNGQKCKSANGECEFLHSLPPIISSLKADRISNNISHQPNPTSSNLKEAPATTLLNGKGSAISNHTTA